MRNGSGQRYGDGQEPAFNSFIVDGRFITRTRVVIDEVEARRLIDEAIAAGRVTRCPPAAAATVNNGAGF